MLFLNIFKQNLYENADIHSLDLICTRSYIFSDLIAQLFGQLNIVCK